MDVSDRFTEAFAIDGGGAWVEEVGEDESEELVETEGEESVRGGGVAAPERAPAQLALADVAQVLPFPESRGSWLAGLGIQWVGRGLLAWGEGAWNARPSRNH